MITDTFKEAKATEARPQLPAGVRLTDLTEEQVEGLLDGTLNAGNQLFNELLSDAQSNILKTGNADLIEAFKDTARLLLTGLNAPAHGGGFGNRESVGAGVLSMLRDGDTAPFDRFHEYQKHYKEYTPELKATIKALQAELKAHCIENGVKVHSTHKLERKNDSGPGLKQG